MKIDLYHTVAQWCNEPLAVPASHLDAFTSLEAQIVSEANQFAADLETKPTNVNLMFAGQERPNIPGAYVTSEGVAVIRVSGALSRTSRGWHRECGYMSYPALLETVEEAVTHPGVKAVLLEIDCYGGPSQGLEDTARAMRDAAEQSGKPLWAHINEAALSAGFGIGSAASEISIARTGLAGSIGVIAMVQDVSGAAEKSGVKYHVFKAGAAKDDASPFTAMSEDAAARIQADVDGMNDDFCQMVADHRGMKKDAVAGLQAQIFRGEKAVAAGLVDQMEPMRDMLARLTAKVSAGNGEDRPATGGQAETAQVDPQAGTPPQPEEAANNTQAPQEPSGQADLEAAIAKETARAEGIFQAYAKANEFGVSFDVGAAIKGKMSVEEAGRLVLELAARNDAAAAVNPHQPQTLDAAANATASWDAAVKEINGG
ncbi:peptidase S49 [Roseibium sp. TrichSKD4]|uniref:S49 family peptidase n=1 Tax=Roseibium sp. TrichSKD4 TaxID=744980 RepID=UPI0001E56F54|nr:S49 family peptidase [Roseibium sp. TrichSKD4]EFO31343.1 peptidase S49 [Roseibium sp. TrichSKD4]